MCTVWSRLLEHHNSYNRTENHRQWNAVWPPDDGRKDARNILRNNWLPIKSLIVGSSWSHLYLHAIFYFLDSTDASYLRVEAHTDVTSVISSRLCWFLPNSRPASYFLLILPSWTMFSHNLFETLHACSPMRTETGNVNSPVNFKNHSQIHNILLTGDDLSSRVPKYCQKSPGILYTHSLDAVSETYNTDSLACFVFLTRTDPFWGLWFSGKLGYLAGNRTLRINLALSSSRVNNPYGNVSEDLNPQNHAAETSYL